MATVPYVFSEATDQDIQDWANSPDDENTALEKLGVTAGQVERIKKLKRWTENWRTGKATWRSKMNKQLEESKDSTIQKVIAEHSLPKLEAIDDGYQFVIDAPKWFVKGISAPAKS